jgi:tetratricopeptide (TPR) repeat protein
VAHFDNVLPLGVATPVRLDAYQEYSASWSSWGLDTRATINRFERSLELDPDFSLANTMLFWSHIAHGDYAGAEARLENLERRLPRMTAFERIGVRAARARMAGQTLEILSATREAVSLAPDATWLQYNLGVALIHCNRPREAAEVLSKIPYEWSPGSSQIAALPFIHLNIAHHLLGEYEEELLLAKEHQVRFPDVIWFVGQQGDAIAALGRFDEINELMHEFLTIPARVGRAGPSLRNFAEELRVHGYPQQSKAAADQAVEWFLDRHLQRSLRFQLGTVRALVTANRWDEAQKTLDALIQEYPSDIDARGLAGSIAAHLGDSSTAEGTNDFLASHDPTYLFGRQTMWRARIAAQLGDTHRATRLLRQAFSEGKSYTIGLHRDSLLEPLWNDPEFVRLITPKG